MNKKFIVSAIASVAFAFAFATGASAVYSADIYTMSSGYLMVGSGMGAKVSQMPNVMAAQNALNACTNSNLAVDGKFGPLTKGVFVAFQNSKNIKPDGIIGPITANQLAACSGGASTPSNGGSTGSLSGGAGELDLSSTSTDVEDTVKEGEDDVIIFGVEAEADGSDIAITSIKVSFTNNDTGSSENFEKYVDSVSVWLGDKEVGSADADEFSKDSGSQDEFSKTISLSGAVIEEDEDEKLYVAVSAISNIDSDDMDTAEWDIQLETVRFNDATGAILSADVSDFEDYTDNDEFTFEDASTDDEIDLKSSSTNPDDMTVKVDENDESDDYLALAFKLDVDEDSSDVMIMNLPIEIEIDNGGTDADSVEDIIDTVTVKVGSDEWEADLDTDNVSNGSGDATYSVDFDDDEFTIDSGDISEVKVYITFKDQDGNYDVGTTVTATVVNEDIEAETEEDELAVGGSDQVGAELTLDTSVATISNVDWDVPAKGTIIDFLFTVEAEDEDVSIVIADITGNDSTSGTATVGTPTVTKISGDASGSVDNYTVAEGDTARFRVRYAVSGNDGEFANVTITSVAGQEVADDDQVSPTATLDIN